MMNRGSMLLRQERGPLQQQWMICSSCDVGVNSTDSRPCNVFCEVVHRGAQKRHTENAEFSTSQWQERHDACTTRSCKKRRDGERTACGTSHARRTGENPEGPRRHSGRRKLLFLTL